MELESLSIIAIKSMLQGYDEVPAELLESLKQDPRSGVRALAEQIEHLRTQELALQQEQERMLALERHYHGRGFELVAGVDEAGRGPLAGPVVAGAVIFPRYCEYPPARDSKTLSAVQREKLFGQIGKCALAVATGQADHGEIDRLNIYNASLLAMRRAVENLSVAPQVLLVDGPMVLRFDIPQKAVVGGDRICLTVAAASIVAKVTRDRIMADYDKLYPGYGFARHKGYGTQAHFQALRQLGPCPIHRRSFRLVDENLQSSPQWVFFHEALAQASSLEELDTVARGIREVRDSFSESELTSLRRRYKKALHTLRR